VKQLTAVILTAALAGLVACTRHEVAVEPIKTEHRVTVDPIHITVDVNIKIDRQLDNFFDFQDEVKPEPVKDSSAS